MQLRDYQEAAVLEVAKKLTQHRKVVFQLATGGGKTITFSAITKRYIEKSNKSVLILVHRKELMQQTRRTLYDAFKISAQIIVAGMKVVPVSKVYVGMVESTIRRLPSDLGLVIIDEAHNLSFAKIHDYLPNELVIGFTATPLTANNKKPLKDYYEDIVCGVDIPELIENGSLCQNITYGPKGGVNTSAIKVKGGEYDEGLMAAEFSKAKHIQNTVNAYQRYAPGTKCLVFNCNIEHSKLVTEAFIRAGLNCKYVDSTMENRDEIVQWYKDTPNAILCNVAILTTGFDAPDTETVIMNRATLSMPLWLQCTGRGSRPSENKEMFKILDLGENAITHGDWCDSRDWKLIFEKPPKPGKPGIAPVMNCPNCDAMIPTRSTTCKYCNHIFNTKPFKEAAEIEEFVVITRGISVRKTIEIHKDKKEYFPFYNIGTQLAAAAKKTIPEMNTKMFYIILQNYNILAAQWCRTKGKRWNQWHQNAAKITLIKELQKNYKQWQPQ